MSREGVVASFGFTSNTANTISERLMVARQVVIPNTDCKEVFERPVMRTQFCAQDQPPQPPAEDTTPPGSETTEDEISQEEGPTEEENGDKPNKPGFPNYDWTGFGSARSLARQEDEKSTVVLSAVCRGDTGSALVYRVNDRYVAYGIVSRVPNGCNRKQPALYTSLSAFTQWIEDATLGAADLVNA